ncbi:hypothetical protein M441DRAFT_289835 [Trichoderma asperellum CBS 433.97]|uniref:Uncharacterized protein n=1 Tax=Trichoderma asperellum (strain ATCC 204424 / CBS 433.97 / NBRC 101777) TaxID=1042311 RepID=A0A2T3YTZ5_TRIA4|nr:hypothetical protein M441DRAFT_289835 [Trichoderma asperellum CBS 433.97]PTB35984.1 hypothetical protein M441DRAFT_289835 [Trichoderma asperellum CBS 433.97]
MRRRVWECRCCHASAFRRWAGWADYLLRAHEAAPIRKALRHTIHWRQSEKKEAQLPPCPQYPARQTSLEQPPVLGLPRCPDSRCPGAVTQNPICRIAARMYFSAPATMYPVPAVPWPDIPLFSLFSSARPSLRPTWNANSLDRILCLLRFSRVVVQQLRIIVSCSCSLVVFLYSFHFLGLYRHRLLCFPPSLAPFLSLLYSRTLASDASSAAIQPTRSHPSQPLARIPLGLFFVLGPCQKPGAGWVLRLCCIQAFAAIALVPATACAQKQARRRYSLQRLTTRSRPPF